MPLITSRTAVTIAALLSLLALPRTAIAQESFLRDLSPQAIEDLVASTRPDTPARVTVANRPIITLRASVLGRSSADRAAGAEVLIRSLATGSSPLAVSHRAVGPGSVISIDGRDVFAIVPKDVDELRGETVEGNTAGAVRRLQQALTEVAEARYPWMLFWAAVQAGFATIVFALVIRLLLRMHNWAALAAGRSTERHLTRMAVGSELVRNTRLVQYVRGSIGIGVVVVGAVVAYLWLTFVLRRFPYTRPWGEALRAFLVDRLTTFGERVVGAIPDLFTIILIVIATRLLMRPVQLIFAAIEEGRLQVMWIYPETAASTRKLTLALMWLFALVVAYPYFPGADTDAFKGVSVFVGLVVSLGSSGLVNQVMSGLTLTYSRALRRGDYVRVGDVEGTVSAMGTLSTKIETPKREEVTIPNAVLVSQEVTNYTRHADRGVFVATEVTIGYDGAWRKVVALLLKAAQQTRGVRAEPAPFVIQKSLEDSYVRYALLVCIEDATRRGPILDGLHANIQDAFNEEGLQIMSPNYEGDPGAPKIVPKAQWFA